MSIPEAAGGALTGRQRILIGVGAAVLLALGVALAGPLSARFGTLPVLDATSALPDDSALTHGMPAEPLRAFGPWLLPLGVVVALIYVAVLDGWPKLLSLPSRSAARGLLGLLGACALVVGLFGGIGHMALLAALAVPAMYVGEMARSERKNLLVQVAGTYMGVLLGMSAAMWLMAVRAIGDWTIAMTGAAVLLAGTIALYLVRGRWRPAAASGAGLVGGLLVALIFHTSFLAPLVLAGAYGVLAWGLGRVVHALDTTNSGRAASAFVLLPHCALGAVCYTLALLLP